MDPVRELGREAGPIRAQLAAAAGTSQPTIAAYEAGRKSPTLHTLERIARSVGLVAVVSYVPASTREDRRSLALHRAIVDRFVAAPSETLHTAQRNLALMWEQHPRARDLLREWGRILRLPIHESVEAALEPGLKGRDLRRVTPFAGVLTAAERTEVFCETSRNGAAAVGDRDEVFRRCLATTAGAFGFGVRIPTSDMIVSGSTASASSSTSGSAGAGRAAGTPPDRGRRAAERHATTVPAGGRREILPVAPGTPSLDPSGSPRRRADGSTRPIPRHAPPSPSTGTVPPNRRAGRDGAMAPRRRSRRR